MPGGRRNQRSAEAEAYRALYKTADWSRLRKMHLAKEPLCRMCLKRGFANDGSKTNAGKRQTNPKRRYLVVDHIVPHKGDRSRFNDPDNLQSLCPDDHDSIKQSAERLGYSKEVGLDGWPCDERHPANRAIS